MLLLLLLFCSTVKYEYEYGTRCCSHFHLRIRVFHSLPLSSRGPRHNLRNRLLARIAIAAEEAGLLRLRNRAMVPNQIEASHSRLPPSSHAIHIDDIKHIRDDATLQIIICGVRRGERGGGVDFEEPRAEIAVEHDIIAVEFEASAVLDDDVLDRKEGANDDALDVEKCLIRCRHSARVVPGHVAVRDTSR